MPNTDTNTKNLPDNELDLADIISVVFYRWKLIALGLLLGALNAALLIFISPVLYDANVMLEIGKYRVDNRFEFVENPVLLTEKIIFLAKTIKIELSENGNELPFNAETDLHVTNKNSGIILIELRSPQTSESLQFLRELSDKIIRGHNKILFLGKQNIKEIIKKHQNEIKHFSEESLSAIRKIKIMENEKISIVGSLSQSNKNLAELLRSKAKLNADNKHDPIALVLFSTEIQSLQSYINDLERRLFYVLPQEVEKWQLGLKKIEKDKRNLETELESNYIALENHIDTQIVYEPIFPSHPSSPNIKKLVIINVLGFGVLFLFLAFIFEYYTKNRARIRRSIT